MTELLEFRYPFNNFYEFVGHAADPASFHLVFAWVTVVLMVASVLRRRGVSPSQKLLALYFSLALFNNPAFQLLPSCSLGDLFGIAFILLSTLRYFLAPLDKSTSLIRSIRTCPAGKAICVAGSIIFVHALFVGLLYPDLNMKASYPLFEGSSIVLTRFMVIARIFVLGFCALSFDSVFGQWDEIWWLVKQIVNFAVLGLAIYVLQACMLLVGVIPYGLYLDAGFVGFPSFGSVSIERGHFGKLMTPLFPIFLLAFTKQKRLKSFALFGLISLVNFSASSLTYFSLYTVSTIYAFKRQLMKPKFAAAMIAIASLIGAFVFLTWSIWMGVIDKITLLAVDGGGNGGRSIDLLISSLKRFPLGITYGGSTLRQPPGLPEINSGLYAFISQESFLAIFLGLGFLLLLRSAWLAIGTVDDIFTKRAIRVGIIAMPFIFVSDSLWFVPSIWLPVLLAFAMGKASYTAISVTENINPAQDQFVLDMSSPGTAPQAQA